MYIDEILTAQVAFTDFMTPFIGAGSVIENLHTDRKLNKDTLKEFMPLLFTPAVESIGKATEYGLYKEGKSTVRNNAVFPLVNSLGLFSGWVSYNKGSNAKYIFDGPYGFNQHSMFFSNPRKIVKHCSKAVLVEGIFDVISLEQYVADDVTVLGLNTADISSAQLGQLSKFDKLWHIKDNDGAGNKLRKLLRQHGIKGLDVPDKWKDVDLFLRSEGRNGFNELFGEVLGH